MGNIINVKELARKYKEDIKAFADKREQEGKSVPTLATVLVGDDDGSKYYLDSQTKVAKSLNLGKVNITLPASTTEEELLQAIDELNQDKDVHGIMVPCHCRSRSMPRKLLPLSLLKKTSTG